MSNYLSEDGTFINSLIGEGSLFKGDLDINGLLRIDGDFKGEIKNSGKVLIGRSGRVEATVNAGTVVIGGVLRGNVKAAEKIVVLSTGMVIGNLSAPRLLVEDGVLLNGNCSVTDNSEPEPETGTYYDVKDRFNRFVKPFRASAEHKRELETVSQWTE